jgi:hypothetical protein
MKGWWEMAIFSATSLAPNNISIVFDEDNDFTWTYEGDGVQTDYQVLIYDNDDNTLTYDSTKTTSSVQSHTVPNGTLSTNKTYKFRVVTWDGTDTATSKWSVFFTNSSPSVIIGTLPTNVQVYEFFATYTQSEGVPVTNYRFLLYLQSDTNNAILDSGLIYPDTLTVSSGVLRYTIDGLSAKVPYAIKCVVLNQNNVEIDSGLNNFTVDYRYPIVNSSFDVAIDNNLGHMTIDTSGILQIIGYSEGDTPTYESFWSPELLDTELWLDANQQITVKNDSGQVSRWNDKSGNRNDATQITDDSKPNYDINLLNTHKTITFDNEYMDVSIVSAKSIFVVTNNLNGSFQDSTKAPLVSQSDTDGVYIITNSVDGSDDIVVDTGTGGDVRVNGGSVVSGTSIDLGRTDAQNKGTNIWNIVFDTAIDINEIGKFGLNVLIGDITEVIVLTSEPSATDREKIEGYLAWKWGLISELPALHAYKSDGSLFGFNNATQTQLRGYALCLTGGSYVYYTEEIPVEYTLTTWIKIQSGFDGDLIVMGDKRVFFTNGRFGFGQGEFRTVGRNIELTNAGEVYDRYVLLGFKHRKLIIKTQNVTEILTV